MEDLTLLGDLVILFAAALPIVLLFQRLRQPTVIGFVLAGTAIGPHGVGFIAETAAVDHLAELGLVLLLFVVGLELSLRELLRFGRRLVLPATAQVVVTTLATFGVARGFGMGTDSSLLLGFLVVHSSTAIVLKLLDDRGEVHAPHGRIIVGVLLVQDLCFVPMVLLVRLLADPSATAWTSVVGVLAQAIGAVAAILAISRLVVPRLLRFIVDLRSRELFTATIVFLCLGSAWMASRFGLSLAVGALIAGLVIADSEYSHQAVSDVLPFRDAFNSIFFISMGMLLRPDFLLHHAVALPLTAILVLLAKGTIVAAAVWPFYRSLRLAVSAALPLASLGELSFVLAQVAVHAGLLRAAEYEAFLGVAVLSMIAAPFLVRSAPALGAGLEGWFAGKQEEGPAAPETERLHVVIIGYGLNGENLAHVLRQTGLTYRILELSAERLALAQRRSEPVLYGDATRVEVLKAVGVERALVVVVAISDPVATRRIVVLARHLHAEVPILVRTRYVSEIEELQRLGATEIVPEEFETSVEIFARVLRRLRVPRNVIQLQAQLLRQRGYSLLRSDGVAAPALSHLEQFLATTLTETFLVAPGSPGDGATIRSLRLRHATGVTVIAVVRDGKPFTNPSPDLELTANDVLVLLGSHAELDAAMTILGGGEESAP